MGQEEIELHALDHASFLERVHSFEFWFGAVQGYLEGTEYGHRPETPDVPRDEEERERLVTILCSYCIGEAAALEGAGGLIEIAPNQAAKVFLATQAVDEGRHLEVLSHRLRELGVTDPEEQMLTRANPSLVEFRRRLLELVHGRDWIAAIFAQNVVLESMEFAAFQSHAQNTDPRTREILLGIIKDERRHIGFGENELGRRLRENPSARDRLLVLRQDLDYLVLRSFQQTMDQIGTPRDRREDLGRQYLQAVERLGFA